MKSIDIAEPQGLPEIETTLILSSKNKNVLEEITMAVQMNPTQIRMPEDYKVKEFAAFTWQKEIKMYHTKTIADPLNQLVLLFDEKILALNRIRKLYNLSTYIVIVIHAMESNWPEIVLDPKVISFADKIGAEISFDLYNYVEEEI